MNKCFKADLAGLPFSFEFLEAGTEKYFELFRSDTDVAPIPIPSVSQEDVSKAIEDMNETRGIRFSESYMEHELLLPYVSSMMLKHDACIFHGTAFLWRGKAWIFTAPSGTGKTTQLRLWEKLLTEQGEAYEVINGDKPVIRHENEKIYVYPSPWLGKERYGTNNAKLKAELGGIIYLQQAKENTIMKLNARQAAAVIFLQFLAECETAEEIHLTCRLEEKLLSSTPVWLLRNKGDDESARMMHDLLIEYQEAANNEDI